MATATPQNPNELRRSSRRSSSIFATPNNSMPPPAAPASASAPARGRNRASNLNRDTVDTPPVDTRASTPNSTRAVAKQPPSTFHKPQFRCLESVDPAFFPWETYGDDADEVYDSIVVKKFQGWVETSEQWNTRDIPRNSLRDQKETSAQGKQDVVVEKDDTSGIGDEADISMDETVFEQLFEFKPAAESPITVPSLQDDDEQDQRSEYSPILERDDDDDDNFGFQAGDSADEYVSATEEQSDDKEGETIGSPRLSAKRPTAEVSDDESEPPAKRRRAPSIELDYEVERTMDINMETDMTDAVSQDAKNIAIDEVIRDSNSEADDLGAQEASKVEITQTKGAEPILEDIRAQDVEIQENIHINEFVQQDTTVDEDEVFEQTSTLMETLVRHVDANTVTEVAQGDPVDDEDEDTVVPTNNTQGAYVDDKDEDVIVSSGGRNKRLRSPFVSPLRASTTTADEKELVKEASTPVETLVRDIVTATEGTQEAAIDAEDSDVIIGAGGMSKRLRSPSSSPSPSRPSSQGRPEPKRAKTLKAPPKKIMVAEETESEEIEDSVEIVQDVIETEDKITKDVVEAVIDTLVDEISQEMGDEVEVIEEMVPVVETVLSKIVETPDLTTAAEIIQAHVQERKESIEPVEIVETHISPAGLTESVKEREESMKSGEVVETRISPGGRVESVEVTERAVLVSDKVGTQDEDREESIEPGEIVEVGIPAEARPQSVEPGEIIEFNTVVAERSHIDHTIGFENDTFQTIEIIGRADIAEAGPPLEVGQVKVVPSGRLVVEETLVDVNEAIIEQIMEEESLFEEAVDQSEEDLHPFIINNDSDIQLDDIHKQEAAKIATPLQVLYDPAAVIHYHDQDDPTQDLQSDSLHYPIDAKELDTESEIFDFVYKQPALKTPCHKIILDVHQAAIGRGGASTLAESENNYRHGQRDTTPDNDNTRGGRDDDNDGVDEDPPMDISEDESPDRNQHNLEEMADDHQEGIELSLDYVMVEGSIAPSDHEEIFYDVEVDDANTGNINIISTDIAETAQTDVLSVNSFVTVETVATDANEQIMDSASDITDIVEMVDEVAEQVGVAQPVEVEQVEVEKVETGQVEVEQVEFQEVAQITSADNTLIVENVETTVIQGGVTVIQGGITVIQGGVTVIGTAPEIPVADDTLAQFVLNSDKRITVSEVVDTVETEITHIAENTAEEQYETAQDVLASDDVVIQVDDINTDIGSVTTEGTAVTEHSPHAPEPTATGVSQDNMKNRMYPIEDFTTEYIVGDLDLSSFPSLGDKYIDVPPLSMNLEEDSEFAQARADDHDLIHKVAMNTLIRSLGLPSATEAELTELGRMDIEKHCNSITGGNSPSQSAFRLRAVMPDESSESSEQLATAGVSVQMNVVGDVMAASPNSLNGNHDGGQITNGVRTKLERRFDKIERKWERIYKYAGLPKPNLSPPSKCESVAEQKKALNDSYEMILKVTRKDMNYKMLAGLPVKERYERLNYASHYITASCKFLGELERRRKVDLMDISDMCPLRGVERPPDDGDNPSISAENTGSPHDPEKSVVHGKSKRGGMKLLCNRVSKSNKRLKPGKMIGGIYGTRNEQKMELTYLEVIQEDSVDEESADAPNE